MKYFLQLIFFVIAIAPNISHAQSGWERIGEEGFNSVDYISATKVIAVANEGRILMSQDAGKTWSRQHIHTFTDLVGVSFFGVDRGIIIGFQQGEIFFTTNGGSTWQSATKTISDVANKVQFVSKDTAFICGSVGHMFKSVDGGKTWNALTTGTKLTLNSFHFVDTHRGFAVGDSGTILKTIDGGDTWQPQQSGTRWQLLGLDFLDSQNGIAAGLDDPQSNPAGILLQTTDGGASWVQHLLPDTLVFSVSAVKMFDARHILVLGTQVMFRTSDASVTWSATIIPQVLQEGATYMGLSFLNTAQGFLVGGSGLVMSSQNSGMDWKIHLIGNLGQQAASIALSNMQFAGNGVAYAISQNDTYKSVDSGTTWLWQPSLGAKNSLQFLRDLHFTDADSGFTVEAIYGRLYRTSDGGESWYDGPILNSSLGHLEFSDAQNGYVVGDSLIFHTTDNGYTWSSSIPIHLPGTLHFFNITFAKTGGSQLGFITAQYNIPLPSGKDTGYGRVFRTKDGGTTWDRVLQDEKQPIRKIFIKNPQSIFAAGNMDVLMRSTDGGDSWSDLHRGTSKKTAYFDINFMNDSIGYVVGYDTTILATTDGGNTWIKEDPWPSDDLRTAGEGFLRVLFPYPNTVYLCSTNSFFRKHLTLGLAGVEATHPSDYNHPGKYLSLTNIPNPASRKTDIKLSGLADLEAYPLSLKLYDPLGLEVADLSSQLMENLTGNESHAIWDLARIPNGVYIARITGGPARRALHIMVEK